MRASQLRLIEIAQEPIVDFQTDIIKINEYGSGISTALRHITRLPYRGDPSAPRNLTLNSPRPWDAVMSLVKLAGPGTHGSGYVDTVWRTLDRLSADPEAVGGRRPLVLWLQEIRTIRPIEREMLVCYFEYVAQNMLDTAREPSPIPLRVVLLQAKVRAYVSADPKV